jgi:hypothetical protein
MHQQFIHVVCIAALVGNRSIEFAFEPAVADRATTSAFRRHWGAQELHAQLQARRDGPCGARGYPRGLYDTEWFFGGEMRMTFFDAGWTSREDSTGEFVVSPLSNPDGEDILFWEDVYPVEPTPGGADRCIPSTRWRAWPSTAAGFLDWMKSSSQLKVSKPTPGAIGDIPATVADVRVAADAVNEDPNCPVRACVLFLGFPQWDGVWGIAGGPTRFYLSDVTYGGRDHLFVARDLSGRPS